MKVKSLFCILLVLLLVSAPCTTVFAGEVYDLREIEIRLVEIKCLEVGPDPGSELEVYGNWGYRYNNAYTSMYACGDSNYMDIFPGRPKVLDITRVLRIKYGSSISVGGTTKEEDTWPNPDDNMGENYNRVLDRDLGMQDDITTVSVNYEEGGQKVEAVFEIRTIRFIKKLYSDDWVVNTYARDARELFIDRAVFQFRIAGNVDGIISGDFANGQINYTGSSVTNASLTGDAENRCITYSGYDMNGRFFESTIKLNVAGPEANTF